MTTDPTIAEGRTSLVGTMIAGKYRVDRVLGSGGMGVVVQATHVALSQPVAIKLIRDDVARSPELIARFMREARAAAQLPPEHIARVTDIGQTELGEPFLVMELLSGRDLDAELDARGPLPIEEAVCYILQACEGVAEAHAAGLVHRDLKPANLFIDTRNVAGPVIKVLDFGLSKSYDPKSDKLTQTSSSFGTPGYMSPEQIRSAKYAEPRSDQHALAMILFEILTGQMPYAAKNITALLIKISTEPPPSARALRSQIPRALDAAISRALAKRVDDRFPDLAAFAAAIAPFGGPSGVAIATRIARVLRSDQMSTFAPRPSSPDITRPSDNPMLTLDTHAPTTSNPGLDGAAFRSRTPLIALPIIGAAALIITAIFVFGGSSKPEAAAPPDSPAVSVEARPAVAPADGVIPAPPADVAPPAQPAAPAATETKPPPATVPQAPIAPKPTSAIKPPGSPVRSAPAKPTGTTTKAAPAPTGKQKSARDVFGDYR